MTKLLKLKRLNLWQSLRIDDNAAPVIAAMKNLGILDLAETAVGDASSIKLAEMKRLKVFSWMGRGYAGRSRTLTPPPARLPCYLGTELHSVKSEEDTRLTG